MADKFLSPIEASRISGLAPAYVYLLLRAARIEAQKVDGFWQIDAASFKRQFAHRIARCATEAAQAVA